MTHLHVHAVAHHVKRHRSKYVGVFMFALLVFILVHAHHVKEGVGDSPVYLIAFYKIVECIGDVTIDRLFPDTFLRGGGE